MTTRTYVQAIARALTNRAARLLGGRRLGIAQKLWIGFGAILLLAGTTFAVIALQLISVERADLVVAEQAEPLSAAAFEMEINTVEAGLAVMKYAANPDPAHRKRFNDDDADFDKWARDFATIAKTIGEEDLGQRTIAEHHRFVTLGEEVLTAKDNEFTSARRFSFLLDAFYRTLNDVASLEVPVAGAPAVGRAAQAEVAAIMFNFGQITLALVNHMEFEEAGALEAVERHLSHADESLERLRQYLHASPSAVWTVGLDEKFEQLATATFESLRGRRALKSSIAAFLAQRRLMDDLLDDKVQPLAQKIVVQAKDAAAAEMGLLFTSLVACALLLALGSSLIVRHLSGAFINPVRALAAGAAKLMTEENEPAPLAVTSRDEIGDLTRSFNEAAAHLWQGRAALTGANERLEHDVAARTADLTAAMAKLEAELAHRSVVERDLEHAVDGAEAANKAKSALLTNMSHELRTPLNSIIGFSQIIAEATLGPDAHDKYREYAGDVLMSGQHLLSLINDLLDMAKIESGQFELFREATDPMDIVGPCRRFLQTQADQAGVALDLGAVPAQPAIVHTDQKRLRQILLNLMSNAIKFTPKGGKVSVGVADEGALVDVWVSDTGIGMSPEDVELALEPFRQIDSAHSRKHEGTGLGLPIAKKLTELHDGSFTIDSTPGQGTTVHVRLPKAATKDKATHSFPARTAALLAKAG